MPWTSLLHPEEPAPPNLLSRAGRLLVRQRTPFILPLVVLTASLGASGLIWLKARADSYAALRAEFDYRARDTRSRIERRMQTYGLVLRGAQSLFATTHLVTRAQFHTYISSLRLDDRCPGIQGVGFAAIVKPGELERHIESIRAEGFR